MPSTTPSTFQTKLFIYLSLTFALFVVIGTLSHEGGHWLAMRYYGFKDARINYKSTLPGHIKSPLYVEMMDIWEGNQDAIEKDNPFPGKERYETLMKESRKLNRIITLGGPLQTMLTGTIGLVLMFIYRDHYRRTDKLKGWQWLYILLALFWMRQLFNLATALLMFIVYGKISGGGDEMALSMAFDWPPMMGYYITGGLAAIILAIIFFRFIPVCQRFTFIMASLFGGIGGSILWLYAVGPVVMP